MNNDTLMVVLQVAALVFAVCVHESAHGAVALWCGDPTARDLGRITLNPLRHVDPFGTILLPAMLALSGAPVFGWAKPVPVVLERARDPRRARLLVSAAGPLSNLILAGLFAALASRLRALETAGPIAQCLFWFALFSVLVNVALAVFNLLPVPPLDGFGVVEGLLPPSLDGLVATIRQLGMPILLALIFTGALRNILGPAQRLAVRWLLGHP
ncbi:MAG: site-2 protease family protein [Deltaproteobacteria bacterium]